MPNGWRWSATQPPLPWGAFQEWRKRERLRAELSSLGDLELKDIAITRGEVDYVASNRTIDPARYPIHPSDECLISGTDG
jgi:uncharacterized protein YjiS (DUF1127 family)